MVRGVVLFGVLALGVLLALAAVDAEALGEGVGVAVLSLESPQAVMMTTPTQSDAAQPVN
jgi:hypothetical protein